MPIQLPKTTTARQELADEPSARAVRTRLRRVERPGRSRRRLACFVIPLLAQAAAPAAAFMPAPAETPRDVMRNLKLEGIFDRVELALQHAGGVLAGNEIEVQVAPDGVVVLQGAVPSESAVIEAERLARRQVGVQEVRTALVVDPAIAATSEPRSGVEGGVSPAPDGVPDGRLARALARRVADVLEAEAQTIQGQPATWRVETAEGAVEIAARDGHVRLDGEVESPEQVERLARRFEETRPEVRSIEIDLDEVDDGGFFDFLGF